MSFMERLSGTFRPRPEGPALELVRGPKRWALGARPVSLGRSAESDIVVPGETVSRLHAWIVPGAEGWLFINQGRTGSTVNGEPVQGPHLLGPGDRLQLGEILYVVEEARAGAARQTPPPGRLWRWIGRYGPSEVLGTVASVGAAVSVQELTGSLAAAAYTGALVETLVFYGVMFLRESLREAHLAGARGRPFTGRDLLPVARSMLLEFGAAEALDTAFSRPLCMALGLELIGGHLGGLAGKLAADLIFYGPVLAIYEWRFARDRSGRQSDPRRRTTAVGMLPPEVPEE